MLKSIENELLISHLDVDTDKVWHSVFKRKFGEKIKPKNCNSWREFYENEEKDLERKKRLIAKEAEEIEKRDAEKKAKSKTVLVEEKSSRRTIRKPQPKSFGSRGRGFRGTTKKAPPKGGGLFAPHPRKSILPKR
mmetsp:Transcript_7568/g.12752  ORF Transcript_7568/g.12752 Transcript_7568/m.12752 type:complete len:135 (-) Transcript_7568:155-559(-)